MMNAGIELAPHRYNATLLTSTLCYTRGHTPRIVHTTSPNFHNTRARGRSRRSTLSKMASFIVDSCRDQIFSLETWDGRRTIAWGRCTPLTIVDQFGIKISGYTPSCEALGRLLKKKKEDDDENSDFAYEPIPISFYNCYSRTVRHEKRGIATPDSVSHYDSCLISFSTTSSFKNSRSILATVP